MEPTNFEGCSINAVLPVFDDCNTCTDELNAMCFLDKVGNFTDADCGQCLLAFIGYVDLVGVDNYPVTVDAITDFCIDGLGPPELVIWPARKLEASNVCSGTETDLETVSLTILEIFDGTFPTEAIVPPYTPPTTTTTTGTTSTTGTSSAVHLRRWRLLEFGPEH